jgi:hypothetical protein
MAAQFAAVGAQLGAGPLRGFLQGRDIKSLITARAAQSAAEQERLRLQSVDLDSLMAYRKEQENHLRQSALLAAEQAATEVMFRSEFSGGGRPKPVVGVTAPQFLPGGISQGPEAFMGPPAPLGPIDRMIQHQVQRMTGQEDRRRQALLSNIESRIGNLTRSGRGQDVTALLLGLGVQSDEILRGLSVDDLAKVETLLQQMRRMGRSPQSVLERNQAAASFMAASKR